VTAGQIQDRKPGSPLPVFSFHGGCQDARFLPPFLLLESAARMYKVFTPLSEKEEWVNCIPKHKL
jgi:hypothetical protein